MQFAPVSRSLQKVVEVVGRVDQAEAEEEEAVVVAVAHAEPRQDRGNCKGRFLREAPRGEKTVAKSNIF